MHWHLGLRSLACEWLLRAQDFSLQTSGEQGARDAQSRLMREVLQLSLCAGRNNVLPVVVVQKGPCLMQHWKN